MFPCLSSLQRWPGFPGLCCLPPSSKPSMSGWAHMLPCLWVSLFCLQFQLLRTLVMTLGPPRWSKVIFPFLVWADYVLCYAVLSCFNHVRLFATPWTVARQAPLFMGFSRQEYWSGCHALLQVIFLTQGLKPHLLHLLHWQVGSSPLVPPLDHSLQF